MKDSIWQQYNEANECEHCGRTSATPPPINDQINEIIEFMEYSRIQSAMRGLGYKQIPTEEEMKEELREYINDVVCRFREHCNEYEVVGAKNWFVHITGGVVYARWSVCELGWEP